MDKKLENKLKKLKNTLIEIKKIFIKEEAEELDDLKKSDRIKVCELLDSVLDFQMDGDKNGTFCYESIEEKDVYIEISIFSYADEEDKEDVFKKSHTLQIEGNFDTSKCSMVVLENAVQYLEKILKNEKKNKIPVAILNTSILTAPAGGQYIHVPVTVEEAKEYLKGKEIVSAVGHQGTADILTDLLGQKIPMNRQVFKQELGQTALVFKLNGRPPEGVILNREEMEKIGYTLYLMKKTGEITPEIKEALLKE